MSHLLCGGVPWLAVAGFCSEESFESVSSYALYQREVWEQQHHMAELFLEGTWQHIASAVAGCLRSCVTKARGYCPVSAVQGRLLDTGCQCWSAGARFSSRMLLYRNQIKHGCYHHLAPACGAVTFGC